MVSAPSDSSSDGETRWLINYEGEYNFPEFAPGIPTRCVCGQPPVLKTHIGYPEPIQRKFYSCEKDKNTNEHHVWKLWDEAIMEEIALLKNKVSAVEDRLGEWIGDPGHMSPEVMWDLLHSCEEEKKKLTETIEKVEKTNKEAADLKEVVSKLQTKVYGEKELKLTIAVLGALVCVLAVSFYFVLVHP